MIQANILFMRFANIEVTSRFKDLFFNFIAFSCHFVSLSEDLSGMKIMHLKLAVVKLSLKYTKKAIKAKNSSTSQEVENDSESVSESGKSDSRQDTV
jgi:hypothetical protein